jgi:hypothetical protein
MIEQHLLKPVPKQRRVTNPTVPRWSPPEGSVFVNVDADLFSSSSRMGEGVLIRNHIGISLVAYNQVLDEVTRPELAEAVAVRRAVTLAHGHEEGFESVILALDCLLVIHASGKHVFSPGWCRASVLVAQPGLTNWD